MSMSCSLVHVCQLLPGDRFVFPHDEGLKYLEFHPGAPVGDRIYEVRYVVAQTLIQCLAIESDRSWIHRHIIIGIDELYVLRITQLKNSPQ